MNNRIFIFLTVFLSISFHSYALKSDEKKPIQITANQATVDQKNLTTTFTGSVVITKGSLHINANTGFAKQDSQGYKTLILDGNPVKFEQQQDDGNLIQGQCNHFEFNSRDSLAILKGRARVKDGKNEVSGDTLTYNTQTQVYSARSGLSSGVSNSSRVTVILEPTVKEDKNGKNQK